MLQIDYRSGEALYIQIKSNLKKLILTGVLKEDELLPSVRKLASEFAINVNTVQRAYKELEQEGYIYSIPGKGNFVAKVSNDIFNKNILNIKSELFNILDHAVTLGMSKKDVNDAVEDFFNTKDIRGEEKRW